MKPSVEPSLEEAIVIFLIPIAPPNADAIFPVTLNLAILPRCA
jgi:hypothetical protein